MVGDYARLAVDAAEPSAFDDTETDIVSGYGGEIPQLETTFRSARSLSRR